MVSTVPVAKLILLIKPSEDDYFFSKVDCQAAAEIDPINLFSDR